MDRILSHCWNAWKDVLFPPQCVWCHSDLSPIHCRTREGVFLCEECVLRLVPRLWQSCPKCGGQIPSLSPVEGGCNSCKTTLFHFDTVITLGGYHTELRNVILRMKKPQGELLALSLGRLLSHERNEALKAIQPEGIVPIPMYWLRRFGRGVNSPERLAVSIGKALGIPVYRKVLRRIRDTPPQSGLRPQQRFRNVRGAFQVRGMKRLKERRILLIDDVLTTGATCSEAARTLKAAGAGPVAVVARAQGDLAYLT
jgi:ComF family protein